MKYLDKSFSIHPGGNKKYRDNFDSIFGKKEVVQDGYSQETPDSFNLTENDIVEKILKALIDINVPIHLSDLITRAGVDNFRKAAEEAVSNLIHRGDLVLDKNLMLVKKV